MSEYNLIPRDTRKGGAIRSAEASNRGSLPFCKVVFSGAPSDEETVSIGADTYQFVRMNADSGVNTSGATAVGEGVVALDAEPAAAIGPGSIVRIGTEYMLVLAGSLGDSLRVLRGAFGTAQVLHANNSDVFVPTNKPGAGVLAVPLTTLTAVQAAAKLKLAVDFWQSGYRLDAASGKPRKASVDTVSQEAAADNGVYLMFPHGSAPDTAETLVNGTVTDVQAGQQGSEISESSVAEALTAAASSPRSYAFGFAARFAKAELYTAAGALVAAANQPSAVVDGALVVVTEGGTAFAADQTLRVVAG